MRKVTLSILASVMLLAACKKEDSNQKNYISYKVNGVSFYLDDANGNRFVDNTTPRIVLGSYTQPNNGQYLTIETEDSAYNQIYLKVEEGYTGKGSYSLTEGFNGGSYSTLDSEWDVANQDSLSSGTLTITSQTDNSIEGTFAFDAVCLFECNSSIHLTEGKFRLPFKRQ